MLLFYAQLLIIVKLLSKPFIKKEQGLILKKYKKPIFTIPPFLMLAILFL
jgi:hypothetical protein